MGFEPYLITPVKNGLSQYYKPYLIGNDAFEVLENCYTYRGTVKKRQGYTEFGSLPEFNLIAGYTNANPCVIQTTTPHLMVTGDICWIDGISPATPLNNQAFQITKTDATHFSLQDLNTGANIDSTSFPVYGSNGQVYLPVITLSPYLVPSTSNEILLIFHAKKVFYFNTGTQTIAAAGFRPDTTGFHFTGTSNNFFSTCNYANSLWATNNVDPINYFNGNVSAGWSEIIPAVDGSGTTLTNALLIVPYKGRLVVLNTTEGGSTFGNRARWCQVGTPYTVVDATHVPPSPFGVDASAWRGDIPGRGGFIDAETSENIVSCGIVNDTLIVGFQFSTWKLVYTGNEVLPFIWQRVNNALGSESPFGSVLMDDGLLMVSRRGIIKADINEAKRIDLEIPDMISNFEAGSVIEGFARIFGLRDFDRQLVYWTWGDTGESEGINGLTANNMTPNRLLIYNYLENTWSTGTVPFSCLGRYRLSQDNTWATWTTPWIGDTSTWADPVDSNAEFLILGGRVDSKIYQLDDESSTDDGTPIPFEISTKRFNPYLPTACRCKLGYVDLYFVPNASTPITISSITQSYPPTVTTTGFTTGAIINGSNITIINCRGMTALNNQTFTVSNVSGAGFTLNGVDTSAFPAYVANSGQVLLNGEVTIADYVDDEQNDPIIIKKVVTSSDGEQGKYTRVFIGATAMFHQLSITLSNGAAPYLVYPPNDTVDDQLNDPIKGLAPFELMGIVLHTRKEGRKKG